MKTNLLVSGFRVSAAMQPYVLRLRLRGRDFDFGETSEAAVAFSKCIEDMQKILLSRRISKSAMERAIVKTLEIAADFRLAVLRQAEMEKRNAGAQAALYYLIRHLRKLKNALNKLSPISQGQLYKEVTAVLRRSAFDTEVFIDVIDTMSAILPTLAPRRHADKALDIIHPKANECIGSIGPPDRLAVVRSPLIECWETMPSPTRANVERMLRDKPRPFRTAWLSHVALLLERGRPRRRPPSSPMRKFVVPVAKIWRELGLKVGSAFKDDLHPGGRDGGHGGPVNSRFQRYCHAALSAFGMTDRISADLVRAIKKLSASQ